MASKYWTLFGKGKADGRDGHVLRHVGFFYMELIKAEWEVNQQERWKKFKCYKIWQMMTAMLHSNEQQRSEKDRDKEKGY